MCLLLITDIFGRMGFDPEFLLRVLESCGTVRHMSILVWNTVGILLTYLQHKACRSFTIKTMSQIHPCPHFLDLALGSYLDIVKRLVLLDGRTCYMYGISYNNTTHCLRKSSSLLLDY